MSGILLSSSPAVAATAADYGCDRPIHIAFNEFGALYHQGVGIDPDVIAELAKRTGCRFEEQEMSRAAIWQNLLTASLDMATGPIATDDRRRFTYFIPYLGMKNVIVTGVGFAPLINSFDDAIAHKDWRIGIVQGFVNGAYFDIRLRDAAAAPQVTSYPDQETLYQALEQGDVHAILSPVINYSFYLPLDDQQQVFKIVDVSPAPATPHALIFDRQRFTPAMINAWTRVLEQMRLDGTLLQIYQRRLPPNVAQSILNY